MKNLLYLFVAVLLFSCNSKEKKDTKNTADNLVTDEIRTDLYGSWVGGFVVAERDTTRPVTEMYSNKINILIKKITSTEVTGQSIVAGNIRPLKGFMKRTGNTFYFTLKEPGDDKNDGVFTFEIQKDTLLIGTWTAYDSKKEVTKRKFKLLKKEFKYNPNAMLSEDIYMDFQNPREPEQKEEKIEKDTINEDEEYDDSDSPLYRGASDVVYTINSSTTKLKESQLKNLKKLELEILRNTIFARHGLSFKTKTVRQFFNNEEWYIPVSTNVNDQLTAVEKENIALLKRFEKYATDSYESFGR